MTTPIKPPNVPGPQISRPKPAGPSAEESQHSADEANLLERYNCGPVKFSGGDNALYERHLTFDQVIPVSSATPRDKFEAIARSIRDVLSQRWLKTEQTYQERNAKRVYYLSLEFLMGRALANNITNLMLDPVWSQFLRRPQDRPAGNHRAGAGRRPGQRRTRPAGGLFPRFDGHARHSRHGLGPALRIRHLQAIHARRLAASNSPTTGSPGPTPGKWRGRNEAVEVRLACSFDIRGGALRVVHDRPSTLIGIPYDRPVIGYGGKTINTLRLWSAATPDYFDFQQFSSGDFVGALAETLTAETLTRVLYPDDSTSEGKGLRFLQQYFLVACTLADAIRRFRAAGNDWSALPDKVAMQLNDTHPTLAVPELMRILLDDAKLGWDEAWDLTQRTLAYTNHTLLPEALEKWPLPWFETHAAAPARNHLRNQPPLPRRRPREVSRRRRPTRPREPHRGRRAEKSPHGARGHRRLAQHQRRGGDSFGAAARRPSCRTSPRCSPNGSTTRPTASRSGASSCSPIRRSPKSSPTPSATAGLPTSASSKNSSRWPTTKSSARPSARPNARRRRVSPTG